MTAIDRRKFIGLSAATLGACAADAPPKRPNVLYVFSDQQHAGTVSAYAGDAPPTPVSTPAIDRIAAEGRRYGNSISIYPVCSPYRGMLMSGLYPMRNGVVGNDTPLSNGLPTFGKRFRDAGYRTGYIGKWHLESTRTPFVPPARRQGFDDYWAVHSCAHEHFNGTYYMDDPDREYRHPGYEPDSQTDLAIEFIRQSATEARPFCLAVSFGPPHSPYKAPEKNERRFQPESDIPLAPNVAESAIVEELLRTDTRPISERNAATRKRRRKQLADDSRIQAEILRGYYGACEALDQNIARLLATLDELNLANDTIVVYTSDHGDMVGSHRMVSKQLPFEESIRTPFVLRYPRRVEAGEASSTFMTPVDVLPTLLSLAGIAYDEAAFDGRFDADREGVLIMKMVHGGNPWINNGVRPWRGTRTNRYTYVELEGAPWLLFDNQEDPHQLDNLIGDNGRSGLRSKLQAQMRGLMQEAGDTLSEDEIDAFRARQKAAIPT